MVFILGIALGVTALTLRSIGVIVGVALLIVVAFTFAIALLGALNVVPLLLALFGYNLGIFTGCVAMMTVQKFTSSLNSPR